MAPHSADSTRTESRTVTRQRRQRRCKGWASRSKSAPPGLPKTPNSIARQPRDSASLSTIYRRGTILDSYTPSQYGPRGFGGGTLVILLEPSRVSKAWPTTHAKKVLANNYRLTRLRSQRGSSVSANGSAVSILTVLPKAARVNLRPPIRQRWPAVFGCRPSSWPGLWSVQPSAGCLIAGSELRLGE
jgi:hypothetical protein